MTPFTKYSKTLFRLKTEQITSLDTRSNAFSRSTNMKTQVLIFGSKFFTKSPQNKHRIDSPSTVDRPSPWHKPILHFINSYHLTQTPIQNFLVQFKSMFQPLYFNLKSSTYYFHMKTKILTDFHICINIIQP